MNNNKKIIKKVYLYGNKKGKILYNKKINNVKFFKNYDQLKKSLVDFSVFKNSSYLLELVYLYNLKGALYYKMNDYSLAFENYNKALNHRAFALPKIESDLLM